jgi:integrase/recombinase XerD
VRANITHSIYSGSSAPCVVSNALPASWPELWTLIRKGLIQAGYARSTLLMYRQVLRNFSRFAYTGPAGINGKTVNAYLGRLTDKHSSWSWLAANITVLRTVFDKFGGRSVTKTLVTPRRPYRLPETLSPAQIGNIISAATTLRDQLLLGLVYGCGLKVGEVCSLRWRDIDTDKLEVVVSSRRGRLQRRVPFAPELLPILNEGKKRCPPDACIFRGMREGSHLSTKMASLLFRRAVATAGVEGATCLMTLRHSYALHCMEAGANIRELQVWLGHEDIETTMVYQRLRLPSDARSPLDIHASTVAAPPSLPSVETPPSECVPETTEPAGGNSLPLHGYMPEPPATKSIELPFLPIGAKEIVSAFYSTLKMRIDRFFLAFKQAVPERQNTS